MEYYEGDRLLSDFMVTVGGDTIPAGQRNSTLSLSNPKACVYFCDPAAFRGALLTGTMEVLDASEYKEMLWRKGDELYYPGGCLRPGLLRPAVHCRNGAALR